VGKDYAILLQNLLGHFAVTVEIKPVTEYRRKDIEKQYATFYIGSTYDEPNYWPSSEQKKYQAFVSDAAVTTKRVVWLNYNLWQMVEHVEESTPFAERFGFTFQRATKNGYNRVLYKDTELYKGVVASAKPGADLVRCHAAEAGKYDCAREVNMIQVADALRVQVYAETYASVTPQERTPYFTRSGNFWFVGDIPFTYFSEEDRYLAFADVLHDMLGIEHTTSHVALVRLEAISAGTKESQLGAVTEYLTAARVPFSVATVPFFEDPHGVLSGGKPQSLRLSTSPVGALLKTAQDAGYGSIVLQGKTHQWSGGDNPYNGSTGTDFEFYRVTRNQDRSLSFHGPVPEDSAEWAHSRIAEATDELMATGLRAFAWQAPNYVASAVDYTAIREAYPTTYGRMMYYQTTDLGEVRLLEQFFPYLIEHDSYGYRVIPENLGTLSTESFMGFPFFGPLDVLRHAKKALVVRDGYASLYYDPFLGLKLLQQMLTEIKSLGYTWKSAAN